MNSKSLWGNLPDVEVAKTPVTIMREQASILGEMTNKLLEATISVQKIRDEQEGLNNIFYASLNIVAPILDGYTITVAVISYNLMDLYPVELQNTLTKETHHCGNEAEFVKALETVLTSPAIRNVIHSLLAQSQAVS